MQKEKIVNYSLILSMVIFLLISYIFKINHYMYFIITFLIYGIINRKRNKYTLYFVFLWWYLSLFINKDISCIYFSLIMGLLGNFIGYLLNNNKEKITFNISNKIKKISYFFPIIIFILIEELYFICNQQQYYSISIASILLNIVFIYLIWTFFYFITNTTFRANTITLIIMIIFFLINQFKVYFTGEVISATDLIMVTEAGEIFNIIKSDLFNGISYYRKLIIILIINLIFGINLLKTIDIKNTNKNIKILSFCSVILIILLIYPIEKRDIVLNKYIFNNKKVTKLSSLNDYYSAYGMIGGLYIDYLSTIDYSEQLISEEDLRKMYESVEEEQGEKVFKKPNIIVMLTESFWDITKQDSIEFDVDPLTEYHQLKKDAIVINTMSPTFGGKSSNTEFELITGGSLSYYRLGTLAYFKYYQNSDSYNNPSIIQELKNNGYTTEVAIAETAKTYEVDNVYNKMQFDIKNEYYEKLGYTVSDEYLMDNVIKRFETKKEDEKIFYMTVSMDSHMPYMTKNYKSFDFDITTNLNPITTKMIKSYTQSIKNASLQLKRMYDYIQTLEEDTIIIFLGDHLPLLKAYNNDAYDYMKEFNTGNELEDIYRKYNTETLILSNYEIDYNDLTDMSPSFILTTIINNMDIEVSDYYKWLYSTRHSLSSVNCLIAKDSDGTIYDINNLPVELQKTFNLRKKVQQFLFK